MAVADVWNQVKLLPCSTERLAVLHGSSTTWFQTSCYCRTKVEFNSINWVRHSSSTMFETGLKYLAQEHNIITLTSSRPRGGLGTCPPPLIFRLKWGQKDWKNFFGDQKNPEPWPLELSPRPAHLPLLILLIKQWRNNLMFKFIMKTTYPRDRTLGSWGCVICFIGCLNTFI